MAPRVTRAAARAAATVEICVDEIDVVHVIDVQDEMIPGAKDEVEEDERKVLEAVTGNLVEGTVSEKLAAEEKSGGKKKKKNGTKRGKRKSRAGLVQEPEPELEQQDQEEGEIVEPVEGRAGVEDDEDVVADAGGELCGCAISKDIN